MAEYVEQRMEEMLGEVEQMERVNLLEPKEVRELIKKRKHFEYKIQKKTKEKADYLAYIQYETNLLRLLAMRRENTGYQHKKAEIEGGIKVRINKLFKILEHRFQSDVTVWLSHLHFLKEAQWEASVSRIYLRMLQVHSDKPGLWVAAAQWEFQQLANADNGRQILLRGLRFLPKSWTMHREYLKLELLYVEQLRKRSEVLAGVGAGEDEEEREQEPDSVTDCAIVLLVARAAVEAVGSPQFVVSLLATTRTFPFAVAVEQELVAWLEVEHPEHPVTRDTLARRELCGQTRPYRESIAACVQVYMDSLGERASGELLDLAFTTLRELLEAAPRLEVRLMAALVRLLKLGREQGLLQEHHFTFWLSCLDYDGVPDTVVEVVTAAVSALPSSPSLWVERLAVAARRGEVEEAFGQALGALEEECGLVRVWRVMLGLVEPGEGWRLVEGPLLDRARPGLRLLHLEQAAVRGVEVARRVYQDYHRLPPLSAALHYRMAALEAEQPAPTAPHLRPVLDSLCDQFGASDPLPWLARVRLEREAGRPLEAATIVCRAEAALGAQLAAKFAILREKEGL